MADTTNYLPARAESHRTALVLIDAIRSECEVNALATLNEMHLKVIGLNALLDAGFVVLEGSATNQVKALRVVGGELVFTKRDRAPIACWRGQGVDAPA